MILIKAPGTNSIPFLIPLVFTAPKLLGLKRLKIFTSNPNRRNCSARHAAPRDPEPRENDLNVWPKKVLMDVPAVWVGDDGGNRKLYFDRLLAFSTMNLTVNLEACSPMQDTVTAILRKAVAPYDIVESVKAYLTAGGVANVNFMNAVNGVNYYVVVKHRNSIETWSKSGGEVFSSGVLNYNFTTSASQAFGNNMVLVNTKYSFYTGDVNQDGTVDGSDGALIDNDAAIFASGYLVTDLNCDNIVDGSDAAFADNNAASFVSLIRP